MGGKKESNSRTGCQRYAGTLYKARSTPLEPFTSSTIIRVLNAVREAYENYAFKTHSMSIKEDKDGNEKRVFDFEKGVEWMVDPAISSALCPFLRQIILFSDRIAIFSKKNGPTLTRTKWRAFE